MIIDRKLIASIFILIATILGIIFFLEIEFPIGLDGYFKASYYRQFGPLAICVELLLAGIYMLIKHAKSNFALALFGFTAMFDPVFNLLNLFTSLVPLYATIIFICCGIPALWLAFTNTYKLGRISPIAAISSFLFSISVEFFFTYM